MLALSDHFSGALLVGITIDWTRQVWLDDVLHHVLEAAKPLKTFRSFIFCGVATKNIESAP